MALRITVAGLVKARLVKETYWTIRSTDIEKPTQIDPNGCWIRSVTLNDGTTGSRSYEVENSSDDIGEIHFVIPDNVLLEIGRLGWKSDTHPTDEQWAGFWREMKKCGYNLSMEHKTMDCLIKASSSHVEIGWESMFAQ